MMTSHPNPSEMETLREQAACWFATMRGPDAEARRDAFEAWLAQDPAHRRAYNDIGETFHVGRALPRELKRASASDLWLWLAIAAMVLLAVAALFQFGQLLDRQLREPIQTATSATRGTVATVYRTQQGEIRTVSLPDRSKATLDTETRLVTSYDGQQRTLRLETGRARFEVAHEPRPFVVIAGTATITAHGTVFDVSRSPGSPVRVHLLRGSIDVRRTGPDQNAPAEQQLVRMQAGDDLLFEPMTKPQIASGHEGGDRWPDGIEQYSDTPLGTLVADAARYNRKPIVFGDEKAAARRVSGTFRLQNSSRLAANLAALLDLVVTDNGQSIILSTRCDSHFTENCLPPS